MFLFILQEMEFVGLGGVHFYSIYGRNFLDSHSSLGAAASLICLLNGIMAFQFVDTLFTKSPAQPF